MSNAAEPSGRPWLSSRLRVALPWGRRAHPPPQPVTLLPDGVRGGLGPVQLLLLAAQHGRQALVLLPQPRQLLLPPGPLLCQAGVQVPAEDPLDLLHCLENRATETRQVSSLGKGGSGDHRLAAGECPRRGASTVTSLRAIPQSPSPHFQKRLCHSLGHGLCSPAVSPHEKNTVSSWYLSLSVVQTAPQTFISFTHVPESVNTHNQMASQSVILIKQRRSCRLHTTSNLKFPKSQVAHVPGQRYNGSHHHFQVLGSYQNQKV